MRDMTDRRRAPRAVAIRAIAIALLLAVPAWVAAQSMRGVKILEEQRVALVIGNAAYRGDPLPNPVNDARLIARTLKEAGFRVALHENLDRLALLGALSAFGDQLNDNTVAVLFYAGHGLQLRDRNFMIPVDAEFRREDEIPIHGIDLGFILDRMSQARSRVNVVILDACRDNPFAGRSSAAQGLAQMDAPIGTVLAYATAPGRKAPDNFGGGANSVYTAHLARQLLTPGLPVELMFKRVREGVVRETKQLQIPWEHSSLQGEFAFVPGVNANPEPVADAQDVVELGFWNSIQGAHRADEYRSYLRQYPNGRFAELARSRIAALSPAPAPPGTAPAGARGDLLPRAGDTWRYRIRDQFRFGDVFTTARVGEVTPDGVVEAWTTTSDSKVRTISASLEPGFHALPDWTLAPPEFAPYLLAGGALSAGQRLSDQRRLVEKVVIPLRARVEGEDDLVVSAGRFRVTKLVLSGQAKTSGGTVKTEQVVWYAADVKRPVRYDVTTHVDNRLREKTSVELVEYKLN
jgi:uncharacterized caspase-like protein